MPRYLVVTNPPKPKSSAGIGTQGMTYTAANPPRVQWVSAPTKKEAAQKASVDPGGSAHVVAELDVETFSRAEMAPLVSDAPRAMEAHVAAS